MMVASSAPGVSAGVLPDAVLPALPGAWADEVASRLFPGEQVLAWLETDLDTRLRYASGLVVVTDRRMQASPDPDEAGSDWRTWEYRSELALIHRDHHGVGMLELVDRAARLGSWRYTLGSRAAAVGRLVECFTIGRDGRLAEAPPLADPVCPGCHRIPEVPLLPGEDVCAACGTRAHAPTSARVLFRLWRFARPYRRQLLAGFLLTLGSTAAALVPPYLTMPLMDDVLIPHQNGKPIDPVLVASYLAGLLAAAILAWGLGWARTYTLARISERIGADLRTAAYEHLLGLSHAYFGGKRTGDLMARIGTETDRLNLFLSLHLLDFATDVLMMGMTVVILVSIDPWLALATLAPLPVIAWLIHQVRDRLRTGFEKVDRVWAEVTSVLADTIPGVRVVKAFAQEKREAERFRAANLRNLEVNDRVNGVWALFTPTITLLTEAGLLVVWIFGIWQVSRNEVTVGVLTAFLAYISRFYLRLDSMSRIVSFTEKAAAGTKRIFEILDHVSSVPEPAQPVRLAGVRGHFELQGVGFRYGTRSIVRDVDMTIEPGEMVGLVGHSGSGKSTLVNLICRFYDVTAGAILLDGHDIRSLSITGYRRHIGLVLQEPFLFFGTVAENIAYGKPEASRAEIVAAARAAHAHEFILRLPHGYDSLVGERGQALSGGERQRISIARALLIDPRILILDEATSSVDTATEQEIQKALENLVRGRTTIAIAHRLSTLRSAHRLIVLDRGSVIETGSHAELMAREGAYYHLYQAQVRNVDAENGVPRVDMARDAGEKYE
ncbi:ABC transporter ATP-binding protein [Nitrosovibrio sp. Nv17]|uniref:cyanophycin metabolism-associated ABC transporter n=1 Tax=Nitrosovibrio sp. Nv17 TaxID=1855339 RepID=UPI000908593E|nr:ABC transporter ATP-binding protein [Nitrosovibrio sp. Nv17]SFW11927.1 ATP-binding cassette, subfamily B [Nitrosovibrio sp. Nv17]